MSRRPQQRFIRFDSRVSEEMYSENCFRNVFTGSAGCLQKCFSRKRGNRWEAGTVDDRGKCFLWQILNLENMICFESETWTFKSLFQLKNKDITSNRIETFFWTFVHQGGCICCIWDRRPVIRAGQLHICNPHLLFRDKCRAAALAKLG